MTNINGKAYGPECDHSHETMEAPLLKLFFFILAAIEPLQNGLKNLSFIHFARWVCIARDGFPRLADSQPVEQLKYDFCSSAISTELGTSI